MEPLNLPVNLGDDEKRNLIGELVQENRGLRLVLAHYVAKFGVIPEVGGPVPESAEAPEAEPGEV